MSAVQCRNGQDIHESKDNGKECRHVPELMPVPRCREDTADCSETAELLNALFGEKILHLADVTFQRAYSQGYSGRDRSEEAVFFFHDRQQFGCLHGWVYSYIV